MLARRQTFVARTTCLALALFLARAALAQHDDHDAGAHTVPARAVGSHIGTVVFPNSGARAAQAPFLRGVALLHSFEYDDAAEAFRAAERADSGFALAYWLEALTYSHVLWGEDDPERARTSLARLGRDADARLAKARTPRERAFGAAIEAYYAPNDLATRARALDDSLGALVARDTTDAEASAFASLAAMMAHQVGALTPEAARAAEARSVVNAERVFRANPNHPGAAHYLIHVSDMDASFAAHALPAARAYAKIAPDADHALHMPSHVFLKLGMWNETVASNERAWAASRAWVRSHHLAAADQSWHELEWLQYGYLQQGRWRAARALIDTARTLLAGADLGGADRVDARYAIGDLQFLQAMETERWADARIDSPVESPPGPSTSAAREAGFLATSRFAHGAVAAMHGDTATAGSIARALGGVPDSAAAAGRRPFGVMIALTLDALRARARGDSATALAQLRSAAVFEDRIPNVGPPTYLSAHELLGASLLAANDPRGAAAEYERALAHQPGRSLSLLGLARARKAFGDLAGARAAYVQLAANWAHADADLPALAEVRAGAR